MSICQHVILAVLEVAYNDDMGGIFQLIISSFEDLADRKSIRSSNPRGCRCYRMSTLPGEGSTFPVKGHLKPLEFR